MIDHIKDYLEARIRFLEKTLASVSSGDPFLDSTRLVDNANDDEAYEMVSHGNTVSMEEEILREITQIKRALTKIQSGEYGICEDCGKKISIDRLTIEPEATLCANCKAKRE